MEFKKNQNVILTKTTVVCSMRIFRVNISASQAYKSALSVSRVSQNVGYRKNSQASLDYQSFVSIYSGYE